MKILTSISKTNTLIVFYHQGAEEPIGKGLPLCYVILIKPIFLLGNEVRRCIYLISCLPHNTSLVCSGRTPAELRVDNTLCDYEMQNESVPLKDILVINKPVVCTDLCFKAS